MKIRPHAVVVGLDCITGLQSARILAQRDVPVIGLAANLEHPCARTNVCQRIYLADHTSDELFESLIQLGRRLPHRAVLFPCTDLSVLNISRHREQLAPWFRFILPDPDVVEMLVDKAQFYQYAQYAGLPIPKTAYLRRGDDARAAARELSYPCLLKPALKTRIWQAHTRAKAFKVSSVSDMVALAQRCLDWAEELVLQEWVPGSVESLFTCNCYFSKRSQPMQSFVTRKLREWPPAAGTGSLGEACHNEIVRDMTVHLFADVHLRGLGYLEVKQDARSGRYFIIEPNIGRPTGRSATAEAAGVELLYTMYCDALERPLPAPVEQNGSRVKWIYLRRDVQAAFRGWRNNELSFSAWWNSLRGSTVEAMFSWRDPAPFFADWSSAFLDFASGRKRLAHGADDSATKLVEGEAEPSAERSPTRQSGVVDFDIHGIVGVRLLDTTPEDVATIERQIGAMRRPLTREPEIIVRFVEKFPTPDLRVVELEHSGFTDEDFYLLQSRKRSTCVRIAFDRVGGYCEILCEHGIPDVPFLVAILNLTALRRDCVSVHASAFRFNDVGVLTTGWSKGGKTEALLAFAGHGAEYVGDEWILLQGDGQRMYGIPQDIHLQDWHLRYLPSVRAGVRLSKRALFGTVGLLDRAQRRLMQVGNGGSTALHLLQKAMPALRRQLYVRMSPEKVFGKSSRCHEAVPEKVFFMLNHQRDDMCIEPADPVVLARRMAASIRYEQLPFLAQYLAYRFAFPENANELVDGASESQQEILVRALAGKEAYVVRHPYPCDLERLYEAMRPYCETKGTRVRLDDSQKATSRTAAAEVGLSAVAGSDPSCSAG